MDDLVANVAMQVLQKFSPTALLAVVLVEMVSEGARWLRGRRQSQHTLREIGAYTAAMAVMTAWAFLALAIPVGAGGVASLDRAAGWLLAAGFVLYLLGALPLGYLLLGLLVTAQQPSLFERRAVLQQHVPAFVLTAFFKAGVVVLTLAMVAFPALMAVLPGDQPGRAALIRYTVVALLLADTLCYGWVLVSD